MKTFLISMEPPSTDPNRFDGRPFEAFEAYEAVKDFCLQRDWEGDYPERGETPIYARHPDGTFTEHFVSCDFHPQFYVGRGQEVTPKD